jgi:hypothetical protein
MPDATQVRVGVTGNIYKASIGTALPTNLDALPAEWIELGYTEKLPNRNVNTTRVQFTPAQSLVPVREVITGQMITETFTCWQTNADTLKLAYGGGTVTAGSGDLRIFDPPATLTVSEGIFVYDIIDGDIVDRVILKRASYSLGGDISRNKDGVTGYPITLMHLAPADGSASWRSITDDTNVEVDA